MRRVPARRAEEDVGHPVGGAFLSDRGGESLPGAVVPEGVADAVLCEPHPGFGGVTKTLRRVVLRDDGGGHLDLAVDHVGVQVLEPAQGGRGVVDVRGPVEVEGVENRLRL